jgi:hypothetical protein
MSFWSDGTTVDLIGACIFAGVMLGCIVALIVSIKKGPASWR